MALDVESNVNLSANPEATTRATYDLKSCDALKLHELTKLQIIGIALSGDFDKIHRRNKEVGAIVTRFHEFFEWHKVLVETMRDLMKPKHGSKKRTLVDGEMLTWGEYCRKYYGVGHDWVARMIRAEHTQDTPEPDEATASASTETPKRKTKAKRSFVRMEKADYDKALNEQWNKGVMSAGLTPEEVVAKIEEAEQVVKAESDGYQQAVQAAYEQGLSHNAYYEYCKQKRDEQCEDGNTETEQPKPTPLDVKDPYFHFHQFKDEPQTMASELAAMLLEFHMDEQQTTTLLDLVKKQLKAQRKALVAA